MKPPKVLIVDDEKQNLELLEAMVAPLGVEIVTASDGTQALDMVRETTPDAVLLDIGLPDMSGIDVCRRMKKDSKTRNIPVVFITAFTDVQHHADAVEAGGIGFVIKPVQDILVEASVRNALRMKNLTDEVEELMRQRKSLTHMIIHDINNLLTLIIPNAEMLHSWEDMPSGCRESVVLIEKSMREIKRMVSSLLEIVKLESGTLSLHLEDIDIREEIEQRAGLLRPALEEKCIRLKLPDPGSGPRVQADAALLSRFIDNLLYNAVTFSPEGGAIDVVFSQEDDTCRVAVTNDGGPIPPEYHAKIFDKFAQVEMREQSPQKGIGLGLAFCKMAVEAMKGTIYVESPVSDRIDGVRFSFCLPAAG